MKSLFARMTLLLALCAGASNALAQSDPGGPAPGGAPGGSASGSAEDNANKLLCRGRFPNPITDICWSCILPLSIGSIPIANMGGQEDNDDHPPFICSCGVKPYIGLSIGFWEPARTIEIVRRPYCLVSMGGMALGSGSNVPMHGRNQSGGRMKDSFYQAHYYANPVISWMNLITDMPCKESGKFDLVYMTEPDPTWDDDALSAILTPESSLFANATSVLSCAADCVKASVGFGFKQMHWCAGCQGLMYPLNGRANDHGGGIRVAELLTHRITAKMHREMIARAYHGAQGLCGSYTEILMDKTAYKTQLLYPVAQTQKINGKCCQPFGRTTALWGAGREFPATGEDFTFMTFRKRNCCVGY